jgi:GTP-binding protein HflX
VLVSALTGAGLPELRAEMAALLASLWVDVDVVVPYAEGALLSQVRERGSTEAAYDESGVHVVGRVPPAVAAALRRAAGIEDEVDVDEIWGQVVDGRTDPPENP